MNTKNHKMDFNVICPPTSVPIPSPDVSTILFSLESVSLVVESLMSDCLVSGFGNYRTSLFYTSREQAAECANEKTDQKDKHLFYTCTQGCGNSSARKRRKSVIFVQSVNQQHVNTKSILLEGQGISAIKK